MTTTPMIPELEGRTLAMTIDGSPVLPETIASTEGDSEHVVVAFRIRRDALLTPASDFTPPPPAAERSDSEALTFPEWEDFAAGEIAEIRQPRPEGETGRNPAGGSIVIDRFEWGVESDDEPMVVGSANSALFDWNRGGAPIEPDKDGFVHLPATWLQKRRALPTAGV